jgi:hypothetical protein
MAVRKCMRVEKRRQPDASPTRMRAIKPPRNNAARIHSATCGRLRISPRGGSFCRANSSESPSLSSAGWGPPRPAAGAVGGSRGSSLNSRGTLTMLAPKKSKRQGNVDGKAREKRRLASALEASRRQTAEYANRALARQNTNQCERHDCASEDSQRHPTPQLRM